MRALFIFFLQINSFVLFASPCVFCNPEVLSNQLVYKGRYTAVLLNYTPLLEGHILITPKRHVEKLQDLSTEEFLEMHEIIQKLTLAFKKVYGTEDYLLCLQNGVNAGQTVLHTHFHMIPRSAPSLSTKIKLWYEMLMRPLFMPTPLTKEQMQRIAEPILEAME